ncbi:MAG TPA: tyrosine-type recombinase/integrase [Candidatus Methylomirabilis sp.]|nr:tyrosine-type recombinase/integrase [Candidatus Methylomirabilis sp.]
MGKRRTQKHLTEEECEDLKNACQTFSDQLIVYGLLYTGMRVDELCHMHPGWINLHDNTITIPREENGWHPKIVKLVDPGTHQVKKEYCSNRIIPVLNPTLTRILESMCKNKYRLDMTPKEVWARLNQLWKNAGKKDRISPHMLRHTCLTMMVRKNYDITLVAAQAGHHNISITWNTYVHSDNVHLIKTVKEKGGI